LIPDLVLPTGLTDGSYSLYYSVDDVSNNTSSGYIGTIVVDTTAPTASVSYSPTSGEYAGGDVIATLT
jgi:hypothetical protein